MFGQKDRLFKVHPQLSLDVLVPQGHFYRHLERKLDLSFVRDLVRDCYADGMGRPGIDPVVFFKLQLIMFFEGIRSERQLMDIVNVNLAHRWYLGYDLDEAVPDHSSLSKIRTRYGLAVFQRFFEQLVERCRDAGLVWGQELYFDGTKVQANADVDSLAPRWYWAAKQHLSALFGHPPEPESPPSSRSLVDKYDGTRFTGRRQVTYERTADSQVSLTDPDAAPMSRGDKAKLGYHTHYVVDGGKARIILAVLVTPASIMDNTPMLDLARWTRFRWQLQPKIAVGDAKYGTTANIVALEADGIRAYVPIPDFSRRTGLYPAERFQYQANGDLYLGPQGQKLPLHARRMTEEVAVYRAKASVCNACAVKRACTNSRSGRHLFRSFFQDDLDRVHAYHATEAYKKALRKRQVWVEPLFGEGKQWHGLRRFRLRRLEKVNIEGLLTAAGQNLKRLLKAQNWKPRRPPAASLALALPTFPYIRLAPLVQVR